MCVCMYVFFFYLLNLVLSVLECVQELFTLTGKALLNEVPNDQPQTIAWV